MTLGEKLFQRRTELGLSQAEVADQQITRNMLSRLEHDQASPSVKTLSHLASKLHVSVSWLLEDGPVSVGSQLTEQARTCFLKNDPEAVVQLLWDTDELSEEGCLLLHRSALIRARHHLKSGNVAAARQLLSRIETLQGSYITEREHHSVKRMLAVCSFSDKSNIDEAMETFLKNDCTLADCQERDCLVIEYYLLRERFEEAQALLNQLSDQNSSVALYLRGRIAYESGNPAAAAGLLERALFLDDLFGYQKAELCKILEQYFLDQEDYKQAYRYASLRMGLIGK